MLEPKEKQLIKMLIAGEIEDQWHVSQYTLCASNIINMKFEVNFFCFSWQVLIIYAHAFLCVCNQLTLSPQNFRPFVYSRKND